MTQQELHELLDYDPNTGEFRWKVSKKHDIKIGDIAGTFDRRKRRQIVINRKFYKAHRLAWFYVYGVWPKINLDHINGDPSDNRIANLRECNQAENCQNRALSSNNTTGFMGVSWDKSKNRYAASIKLNRKKIHLGFFDTAHEAHQAYLNAKLKLHTFNPIPR